MFQLSLMIEFSWKLWWYTWKDLGFLFHGAGVTILRNESVNLTSLQASSPGGSGGGVKNEPEHTMAHRDKTLPESKTLPRIQNTSQNPKTRPRIQNTSQNPKHVQESKTRPRIQNTSQNPKTRPRIQNTSQNPKHFPESKTRPRILKCFGVVWLVLDSGKCFWILGCVLDSGEVFLDSGMWFGFWEVFWILGSVLGSGKCFGFWGSIFGFWKCFWILGSVSSLACRLSSNILAKFFVFCSEKLCVFLYRF